MKPRESLCKDCKIKYYNDVRFSPNMGTKTTKKLPITKGAYDFVNGIIEK